MSSGEQSSAPRLRLLMTVFAVLVAADLVRLYVFHVQGTFTDGFEVVVSAICALVCGRAAARTARPERTLWALISIFFVLLLAAALHDFVVDVRGATPGLGVPLLEMFGWMTYLPLVFLCVAPVRDGDDSSAWHAVSLLDFVQATLVLSVAYYAYEFTPHAMTRSGWQVYDRADVVRDVLITAMLLLRGLVDARRGPRRIFGAIGGVFLLRTFSRLAFAAFFPLDVVIRPATYMFLAIFAERWQPRPKPPIASRWREVGTRCFLGIAPVATPVVVALIAERHPNDRAFLWPLFWFSLVIFVIRTAIAEYDRVMWIRGRDAQSRRLAEAEARFRTLSEHAATGIAVVVNGTIRYANPAFAQIAGGSRDALIGRDAVSLVHPDDRAAVTEGMRRVVAGEKSAISGDVRALRSGDETRHLALLGAGATIDGAPAMIVHALDVTERRKAEDELRRAAAELRRILDNFADAFIQTDAEGRLTLLSPSTARMFGYDSVDEMLGLPASRLWVDPNLRSEILAEVRRSGKIIDREALARRRDGTCFWMSFSIKVYSDDAGRPAGNHGIVRDISERKASEERTRLLSTMLDEAPAGIFVHDDTGTFIYANKRAAALHGYSTDDFVHLKVNDMVDRSEVPLMPSRKAEVKAHGSATFNVLHARKDGSSFPAQVRTKRVEWLGRPALLTVETDLTDIRRAEASRIDSERLAQATIDALKAHVCVLDADGTILAINRAWREFAKSNPPSSADAYLGANYLATCDAAAGPDAPEAAPFAAGVRAVIAEERDDFSMEYPCHAPGEERWFNASVTRFPGSKPPRVAIAHSEITKRRRAENALRASEEQHRHLIENLNAGVVVHAADTSITFANNQACVMLGLSYDRMTGKTAWDPAWRFLRDDGSAMAIEEFPVSRVLETRKPVANLIIGVERSNQRLWAIVNAFPELDAQGDVAHVVVTFVDITQQHDARTMLVASQKRLRAALDTAELGAYEWDGARLVSMDERTAAIFGLDRLEGAFELWQQRVAPEDSVRVMEIDRAINVGGLDVAMAEYQYDHPERGRIWVRNGVTVLARDAEGRMTSEIGVVSDITKHKRADEELRATQERFSAFMTNLPAAAFVQDSGGHTLYANRYLGQLGRAFCALPDAKIEILRRGPVKTEESLADARDAVRTFETIRFPIVVDGGELLVGGISIDVTERKALEAQLVHAQKMEAVGRLASGMAHDFNNILQAMMMTSQVLRVRERENVKVKTAVTEYETLIRRATGLTRQLLLFSRQETARRELLDVGVVIQEVVKMLRRLVRENVALAVQLAPEPLMIEGDATQIDQVIMNLVVNASDAMPNGGTLSLRTAAVSGDRIALEVEDTGHGIPDEIRDRLFEPFFTTKTAGQGTGLGLAVVHGIVTAHGGTIEVESRVGEGTTFRVLLPRTSKKTSDASDAAARHEAPPGRGERILIVEDNAPARDTMTDLLTIMGYVVVAVGSGEEARQLPADAPFDLLLSDVILPGISGLVLARELTARWPKMTFILMSGYIGDEQVRSAVTGEGVRFLQKPFDIATLLQQVGRALTRQ